MLSDGLYLCVVYALCIFKYNGRKIHLILKTSSVNESKQLIQMLETHFSLVPVCKAGQIYV